MASYDGVVEDIGGLEATRVSGLVAVEAILDTLSLRDSGVGLRAGAAGAWWSHVALRTGW